MFDALFTTTTEYKKLSHALSGKGACALFGLPASGRAQVYAALCRQLDKPLCIVTPGEAEATRFAADLNTLGIPAAVFPARDYVLRPIEGTAREYEYRRLAVLGELVGGRLRAVAVPAEALTQFTTPKEDFCANTRTLHAGDTLLRDDLLAALFGAGYTRRAQVDGPGQFSVRGDIVDIFAPDQKMPVRMEFWGDEIDTLHTFDLTTQRREDAIDKFYLSPAREVLFGKPADAAEQLRAFLAKQRGKKKTAMADCMAADLDLLDGGAVPVNMDKYLVVRYPHPATVLDYFDDPILVAEEPASIREADRATAYRRGEELKSLILDGVLCAGLDNLYADPSYLWSKTGYYRTICAENFARSMPDQPLKDIVNAPAHTLPAWNGEVAGLLEDLKPLCDAGYTVALYYGGSPYVIADEATGSIYPSKTMWNKSYILGTDALGRDVLTRLMYGTRISMLVALMAAFVNLIIGILYGGISGYLGGTVDMIMMRIVDIISTIPLTLYVILIMQVLGAGIQSIIVALGSVYWVDMARVVRGQILSLKQQEFVLAAKTIGSSATTILFDHLIPNALGSILVTITMLIPSAIFMEAFLGYLGIGLQPPLASLGTMCNDASANLRTSPHELLIPALMICVIMFAFNFVGDGLRDALDPKLKK